MKRDFISCGLIGVILVLLIVIEIRGKDDPSTPMLNIIQIPDLQEIDLNFACQLYIQQGDEQKIAMEGGSHLINETGFRIKGGKLILRRSGVLAKFGFNKKSSSELLTIYVTLKDIDHISLGQKGQKMKAYNGGTRLSVKIGDSGAQIYIKT